PAAALAATFFALASYAPPRALVGAGLGGLTSFTVYGLASVAALGPTASSGLAAIVVGFVGRVVSRRLRLPPLVMAVAGIAPLLPGLTTYRGLLELSVDGNTHGLITLLSAASVGLALAAGVVLGEFLAQPVRKGLGRLERRLAGPRLVGPMDE
ncbi:MAG TPA: threonine/serine exporter family protein, partial [Pseudonocardiaceae bacterium]|nr:threonine/serine exporter family protein [Pseudonocardiaceae bacterium]